MKRNKVLLGLFVGLMTLAGGVLNAQTGNKFYEIGPSNIAGQISKVVVDSRDTTCRTVFAGAAQGGLFFRSDHRANIRQLYAALGYSEARIDSIADTASWHYIPYTVGGREVVLPISSMLQTPDGSLIIGTGDAYVQTSSNYSRMSVSGKGIFRFDPQTAQFTLLPETNGADFSAVSSIDYYRASDGTIYLFASTGTGLYRWKISSAGAWATTMPERIHAGRVDEIVVIRKLGTAYFSVSESGSDLYKIGDVTLPLTTLSPRIARITSSCPAFGTAKRILIAASPTDPTFVYAMTINQFGTLDGVYLTRNEQNWTLISTPTVVPFSFTSGLTAGAITVDPANPRRVIIAGDGIWVGRGYVDGALFQWSSASYGEHMLNVGNYMSQVFANSFFVHSGIHSITPTFTRYEYEYEGEQHVTDYYTYYIATNGGVFVADEDFDYYRDLNRGLNTVAINAISVTPDGTIVTGARDNASPIIEPILTHAGGQPQISWYDNGSLGNLNHDANVLFLNGSGGATAASAFQQYANQTRRTIFTTNAHGAIGRAWTDYLDYTNTTAWTQGSGFSGDGSLYGLADGPEIGSIHLWETTNNTVFNNYLRMGIDTLGYIIRGNDTLWVNDTAWGNARGTKFRIQRGDKVNFHSRAHNNYPFEYTFSTPQTAKDSVDVLNPIQSRLVAVGDFPNSNSSGDIPPVIRCVWYSWYPTDFTRVWDELDFRTAMSDAPRYAAAEKLHLMSPIFGIERVANTATANLFPRNAVISRDGLNVFVSAYDTATHQSVLFRIRGFENIDFTKPNYSIYDTINFQRGSRSVLKVDTFKVDGSIYFPRAISSLAIDPKAGRDRLIITFDGVSDNYANVAVIENPRTNWETITQLPIDGAANIPAFCAIAEESTGTLFVGTTKGVYTKQGDAAWQVYKNIPEIPVTAIAQQTMKLPIRRSLSHTGVAADSNVFAKTKWPLAIYFGTYGRGIFLDMTYVTDTENEIVAPEDYTPVPIPRVNSVGLNSVSLYPNPVSTEATLNVTAAAAGTAQLRVYDLNGRCVIDRQLGYASEGENLYRIQTQNLSKGMYLVNVIIGGHTAAAKMMVR